MFFITNRGLQSPHLPLKPRSVNPKVFGQGIKETFFWVQIQYIPSEICLEPFTAFGDVYENGRHQHLDQQGIFMFSLSYLSCSQNTFFFFLEGSQEAASNIHIFDFTQKTNPAIPCGRDDENDKECASTNPPMIFELIHLFDNNLWRSNSRSGNEMGSVL